jgi:enterochelin esterase-like enzyme
VASHPTRPGPNQEPDREKDLGEWIRWRQRQTPPHLAGHPHNAGDGLTRRVTARVAAATAVELWPGDLWVHVTEFDARGDGELKFGQVTRAGSLAMHVLCPPGYDVGGDPWAPRPLAREVDLSGVFEEDA